ncbi:MAG: protein kinase [Chloroflexi bacterium]|nr:protein kinase [Chloroflexota bacterium]
MTTIEQEIWDTVHRHLKSIFDGNTEIYAETTGAELSLYEWYVTPHRQDGLDFHLYMLQHHWAGAGADYRYDLLEPRLQVYGNPASAAAEATAIATYTLMLSKAGPDGITHRVHNETRVLVKRDGRWQVVHVHKSPAWAAPFESK